MMPKVPIPAIPREKAESRQRILRACDACHARKTKCSGELPTCSQCRKQGLKNCSYSDKKNVRERRELGSAKRTIDSYEQLLRDLSLVVDEEYAARIADVLEGSHTLRGGAVNDNHDRTGTLSSLHSLDAMPTIDEDLNRDENTRATGYHGQTSEVSWIKHLSSAMKEEADQLVHEGAKQSSMLSHSATAGASYHLDRPRGTTLDGSNSSVCPPRKVTDDLIRLYFQHVNSSLPIIREDLFIQQCSNLYGDGSTLPNKRWIAVFNLVLAIGARFQRMTKTESRVDHHMFFAKARDTNTVDTTLKDHEDLQQVQAQALMAFYFLISSQINSAWKVIGIAARSGIALGLNLHSMHELFDKKALDARVNLWWSIFQVDTLLSLMTGRPSGLGENSSMAPLPSGFRYSGCEAILSSQHCPDAIHYPKIQWTIYQNQKEVITQQAYLQKLAPERTLFLFYLIDLALITHTIANRVYSVDVFQDGWSHIERRIAFYNVKIGQWQSGLHPSAQFADAKGSPLIGSLSIFQTALAFNYYSACIVLNRPCFTRSGPDNKTKIHFPRSHFGSNIASNCLSASLRLISLLPDEPDMDWYLFVGPWWSLLHFIVQAVTILLIHMSIGTDTSNAPGNILSKHDDPFPPADKTSGILPATKKAIRWLFKLGSESEAASRAFDRCYACLKLVAVAKSIDIGDAYDATFLKLSQRSYWQPEQLLRVPSTESSNASPAASSDFFYSPFASFGSAFGIQGHASNPAHVNFEDILASLMDEGQ